MPKKYYAYLLPNNGTRGITENWNECEKLVSGIASARFRGFPLRKDAETWLAAGAPYEPKVKKKMPVGIYFDAGTGRGRGVEISVTDENGKNLLHEVLSPEKINRFGKHWIFNDDATNNYGELLACFYALELALQHIEKLPSLRHAEPQAKHPDTLTGFLPHGTPTGARNDKDYLHISGDSKLVIDYWSKGLVREKLVAPETIELAKKTAYLRKQFEALGGTITRISGDDNPADLGFHR
ncbi:MAG: RNase H1/viroplasmin domain-containing protein [bacterium]|nr:RNase H1/viroplasmin domain-containing protein [bacterium]MDZ4299535.1 RNase H1/viroplasmin domain-containing protein [Candidatus Sungbacteria bacterium]